jgi:hypothetical protein
MVGVELEHEKPGEALRRATQPDFAGGDEGCVVGGDGKRRRAEKLGVGDRPLR